MMLKIKMGLRSFFVVKRLEHSKIDLSKESKDGDIQKYIDENQKEIREENKEFKK